MSKLTAEQRIEKVHVALMRNQKFCLFSGLFMVGKVEVLDDVATARTDGINVAYGRAFVERLNDKQLGFLILHEAMHKAYRHLTTWDKLFKKNPSLTNAACDYVINLQIADYDPDELYVQFPTDENGERMGLIDERFRGMDAGQVFAILEKENNSAGSGNVPSMDEHDWEGATQMDAQEAEAIAKEIDNALRQGALLAAKMNGNVSREIQDLLTPKIDWREVLRDFVKQVARGQDDSTWRRYNKRLIGSDVYMPSSVSRRLGCLTLGIDTSGSIGGEILSQFLGEVKSICEEVTPQKVELMYWDSQIAGHETYEDGQVESLVDTTKPRGGGGTDPNCVVKFMREKQIEADCVVMLTDGCFFDGEGEWDTVSSPVLWCVQGNKRFTAKHGKTVHIGD